MALRLLHAFNMSEMKKFLEDVFGDSFMRVEQFREDQWTRLESRIAEIAKRGVDAELSALTQRVEELERRLGELERERAEKMQQEI